MSSVLATSPKSVASKRSPSASRHLQSLMDRLEDVSHGNRRLARQHGRKRRDFCAQVGRGHDPVDEAETIRLLGADLLSGQKELEGSACANQAREALRAAVTGDEPEVDLGLAELRRLGRDAERAGHRELAPAAERIAVDRGNGRLAQMLDQVEHLLAADRSLTPARRRLPGQLVDVCPGDERLLPRPGDDHHTHGVIVSKRGKRLVQLVEGLRAHGIQDARTIERHARDRIVTVDEESVQRVGVVSAHKGAVRILKYTLWLRRRR